MIYLRLLWSFVQVGLFSIGGGYAAMPLIEAQAVQLNGWLTIGEFTDLITIAEMTPGPIAINAATFVGIRVAGLPGAVVATLGCVLPSVAIVSVLCYVYARYRTLPLLQGVLSSLRPAVVALIAGAGLSILRLVLWHGAAPTWPGVDWVGVVLVVCAFLLLRLRKCSPVLAMALCGAASLLWGMATGQV